MEVRFNEQIFYHNGDNSSFLNAIKLSTEGLVLSRFDNVEGFKDLEIEFSFPNSEIIIKNKASVQTSNKYPFLKFNKLNKKDRKIISDFINITSRPASRPTL